jgi:hypothetical protein
MPEKTNTTNHSDDERLTEQESETASHFDGQLLSDLSVNIVPIIIIAAFVLIFGLSSPEGSDPLLLFHAALVGGVVLVSIVAGWVISREDSELTGSVASTHGTDSDDE